jgi:lipid II:glycine glycyltransferase (peptidoglycan interpeptide bridge formation enzyme)
MDSSWDKHQQKLDASFLQSSSWSVFQESIGVKVHKVEDEKWACLLLEQRSRFGRYLFAPYGPTLSEKSDLPEAIRALKTYGQKQGMSWIRIEPCLGISRNSDFSLKTDLDPKIKTVKAFKQINPQLTSVINLDLDKEAILATFSQTTRRIIRRASDQPQLEFKTSQNADDMKLFTDMLSVVSKRNSVYFHSKEYFLKQAEVLMPLGVMRLELALLNGKPIAGIAMHDFNKVTTYTYAASLPEARETNASALVLWQAIINAKDAGMTKLDLFGIAPEDAKPSHPWYGFSEFKRKFSGQIIKRGETFDIPLSPSYHVYRTALKANRLLKK